MLYSQAAIWFPCKDATWFKGGVATTQVAGQTASSFGNDESLPSLSPLRFEHPSGAAYRLGSAGITIGVKHTISVWYRSVAGSGSMMLWGSDAPFPGAGIGLNLYNDNRSLISHITEC